MVGRVLHMGKLFGNAGAAVASAALLLSACVPAETTAPARTPAQKAAYERATRGGRPPADLERYARDLAMATVVVSECQDELKLNETYVRGMEKAFDDKYGTPLKMPSAAQSDKSSEMEIQDYWMAFVGRNRILVSDPQSWCRAGKTEMARKSGVGKNLLAK